MTPSNAPRRTPPPSFTPQSRGAQRPRSAGDAVPVGSDDDAVDATKVSPVSPPPGEDGAAPQSYAPGGRRPAPAGGARPVPRRPGVTSPATGQRPEGTDGPRGSLPPGPALDGADAVPAGGDGGRPRRRRRRRAIVITVVCLLLACLVAWPVGLVMWADGKLQHVDALSDHAATPGTTYLIAGSDSRAETDPDSTIAGARTDTIMVLHVPEHGTTSLISIPRDSYVKIPGHGSNKINAAYSYGGAPLLVETVEKLTGMKVDHYVEVGFGGVKEIVDAVGGVRLCLDYDVDDKKSHLKWKAGCHTVGGSKALAFSRMRYADPKGDIGRGERQRQVISAISTQLKDKSLFVSPGRQVALIKAGAAATHVDEDAGIIDLGRLALAFRNANGDKGVTGTPPIKDLDYRPGGVGSSVLLDPDTSPAFWTAVRDGTLKPGEVNGMQ